MHIVICPYCDKQATLLTGKEVYNHRKDLWDLQFWACIDCDARVGCHKSGTGTSPLGRLANAELRRAKSIAHKSFDRVWRKGKDKLMSRTLAYSWLAEQLCIPVEDCHIGMFNLDQCKNVVSIMDHYWGK